MRDRKNTLRAQGCQVQLKMSADTKVKETYYKNKSRRIVKLIKLRQILKSK